MPYEIIRSGKKFRLYNLTKKEFVNATFNSRETAINAGKNYMRYRGEKPVVKGNRIVTK